MLHGKKGFERILWAFKNVLNHSVTWLFHDFEESSTRKGVSHVTEADKVPKTTPAPESAPIAKHLPVTRTISPKESRSEAVLLPCLHPTKATDSDDMFKYWALDIYEWLSLVSLDSPRVLAGDDIDPYLSRYQAPENESDAGATCRMIKLSWKGLIPNKWVRHLFSLLW